VLNALVNADPKKIKKKQEAKSNGKEEIKPSLFTLSYLENAKEL